MKRSLGCLVSFCCSALYLFGTFTVLGTHGPGVLIPYISLVFQIQVQVLRSELWVVWETAKIFISSTLCLIRISPPMFWKDYIMYWTLLELAYRGSYVSFGRDSDILLSTTFMLYPSRPKLRGSRLVAIYLCYISIYCPSLILHNAFICTPFSTSRFIF